MNMAEAPTIDWAGKSGKNYRYWIYPFWPNLKAQAGNYVFAKEISPGRWLPVYVGETGDLSERFGDHHKIAEARRQGATHIHVHLNADGAQARRNEESDLIARWNPPANG
jgi:hypothetical protein